MTRQAAIVDPAWDDRMIKAACKELGVIPSIILLTHSHDDHINMVPELVDYYGAQVYMSRVEIEFYKYSSRNLIALNDFEHLWLGGTQIMCLLTPGHTVGGTCFLLTESLFCGDTVFIEGCGTCETVGGSAYQMYDSIQKIKRIVHPSVRIYSGHSYGEDPGSRMLSHLLTNNIYFALENKEHFVQFRMRKKQTWKRDSGLWGKV
ncbi:MBL fold metallo-hydrolase [Bacillus thuringiensis]|uniref:MBL fold metallo-hydrolase n=2 Tax=Bacillus thuringiensis TaxID=1428 RepID=UPI000CD9B904|nr:MBL fold metallo-hydrolase [Bacillus thuringiensis]QFQ28828.1 MBL fold metallo-hydrolase [Bacillus thuringiensis]